MRALRFVALLGLVSMFAGCSTRRNPFACCTTQQDCDETGLPLGSDCAEGLVCIDNGCFNVSCQADSDCAAPTPFCSLPVGTCVGCLDDSGCTDQICDTTTNECRSCTNDDCPDGFCAGGTCRTAIVPRYLPDICDVPAVMPTLAITESTTFDTNEDTACTTIVAQVGGPEICVLRFGTITIAAGAELRATGGRALALVADDRLSVDGAIDVSGKDSGDGAGGGFVSVNVGPTGGPGGGGGGFRTNGGSGGTTVAGGTNNGGLAQPTPTATLHGGMGGSTGGAGGAVTLVSCRDVVSISGILDANGGGGAGSRVGGAGLFGGQGGGSGGQFVLQGADVVVTGQIFANGGGGGAGKASAETVGQRGADGQRTVAAAPGGMASAGVGAGGAGSVGTSNPGNGGGTTTAGATAGGGGGSSGVFQSYTPAGVAPMLTPSVASPAFEINLEITTR